jgi:hypothetical protein
MWTFLRNPCLAQQRARTRQTRHHRADRHADDIGDLAIGQIVDFAQHDRLAKRLGKLRNKTPDRLCVPLLQHFRLRR